MIYFVLSYAAQVAATNVCFKAFALCDTVEVMENGTAYVNNKQILVFIKN